MKGNKMSNDEKIGQLKAEIRDLGGRLYYCSDTGEGRKMRKEIERSIRAKGKELKRLGIVNW